MISVILSIVLGAVAFVISVPMLLPVMGLALGANGFIKEQKKESGAQNKTVKIMGVVGMGLCALVLVVSL